MNSTDHTFHNFEIKLNSIILNTQIVKLSEWKIIIDAFNNICKKYTNVVLEADLRIFALHSKVIHAIEQCADDHIEDHDFFIHIIGSENFIYLIHYLLCSGVQLTSLEQSICKHYIFVIKEKNDSQNQ